jgi:hypothetical protein
MQSIHEIASEICTLAGHLNSAQLRWLQLIAEFDRRQGWSDSATQSCAHWLNWKCGMALGAAREKVRVARALEQLPKAAAAMASGRLSYSKAREITRVANPENEEFLLSIAEHGTATHVENLVRAYRRCQEAEELSREQRQQQSRSVMYRYDDDGSLALTCRLPAEIGAQVLKALDIALEQLSADVPAGTSGERARFSARRADALALVAESFLAHEALEAKGPDRHLVQVNVDLETLRDRVPGCCEFEHGASMAAETARRFACDAAVVHLYEQDGEPRDVGRRTRTISAALRRLLTARDKGCRFPGCCNQRYIDVHHIRHWANGGETKPSNLVSLCRYHHRALHEGGMNIVILDGGALRFLKANGEPIENAAPTAAVPIRLPASEPVSQWKGDRMDYGLAVDVLVQLARYTRYVPAGTSEATSRRIRD